MFEQHRALATAVYLISIIVTLIVAFKVSPRQDGVSTDNGL
jgi:hypothetical protein